MGWLDPPSTVVSSISHGGVSIDNNNKSVLHELVVVASPNRVLTLKSNYNGQQCKSNTKGKVDSIRHGGVSIDNNNKNTTTLLA